MGAYINLKQTVYTVCPSKFPPTLGLQMGGLGAVNSGPTACDYGLGCDKMTQGNKLPKNQKIKNF